MNLLTLAAADLRHRPLPNFLHLMLLGLGVAMITALLLISTQISGRLQRDANGVDLVLGAKGSPLQLILSTVYHLDIPTGNIPLDEATRWANNPMISEAIPLSLGDNARGFRIVGTTPALLKHYGAKFVQGRVWDTPMQTVVGSEVAQSGFVAGATFIGMHGLGASGHAHADHQYRVVGVLAPTGTVLDRLILTSLDSVWEVHGAHHDDDDDHDGEHASAAPGYNPAQEITAMLMTYRTPLAAASLPRMINTQSKLQAAVPAMETARLLNLLGLGFDTLRALAAVLIVAAALSVFVALYTAMETRQYDLAVLRSLGVSRGRVVALLWIQALSLSITGTLIGLLLGHGAVEIMGRVAGTGRNVSLTGLTLQPEELAILLLPLLVGTIAALLPAWRAYRSDVAATLSQG
jgi:putative ABC transport system permease protein